MQILKQATGKTEHRAETNKATDCFSFTITNSSDAGIDFDAIKIDITKNTGNSGSDNSPIKTLSFRHMLEIHAQIGDSFVEVTKNGTKITRIEGEIPVANFGVELQDNEELVVTLSSTSTNDVIDIYALEDSEIVKAMFHIQKVDVKSTEEKRINVVQAEVLAMPIAQITELEVTYKNGRSPKYLPAELKAQARRHNSITTYNAHNGSIMEAATGVLFVLDVNDAVEVNVKVSADTVFYIVDTKA
jgi:hypothetical protein